MKVLRDLSEDTRRKIVDINSEEILQTDTNNKWRKGVN